MISTYNRGSVTLTVETASDRDEVAFTIVRRAPLTADDVRRLNSEIADYAAARGAQLLQQPVTGEWVVARAETVLVSDKGDSIADLRWVEVSDGA
ncbi:hypothetical protein [Mycolicibacterium conceptionense]|uniref:hypothetical protein n=1 Tax=Mycolicibacterium conceptionense TaxID=451644 RepID=UPI0032047D9A